MFTRTLPIFFVPFLTPTIYKLGCVKIEELYSQ